MAAEMAPVSRPGARRRTLRGLLEAALAALFLAGGALLLASAVQHHAAARRLAAEGIGATAEILGKHEATWRSGSSWRQRFLLDVALPAAAGPVEARIEVTRAAYESRRVGDPIAVRYLPDRPQTAEPATGPVRGPLADGVMAAVGILSLVLGLAALRRCYIGARRRTGRVKGGRGDA